MFKKSDISNPIIAKFHYWQTNIRQHFIKITPLYKQISLIYKDIDSIESKVENERVKYLEQVSISSFLTKNSCISFKL
jgi:hypothetical protein